MTRFISVPLPTNVRRPTIVFLIFAPLMMQPSVTTACSISAPPPCRLTTHVASTFRKSASISSPTRLTFSNEAVHQLLSAYSEHPSAFGDDFGIPESGNGIPDFLDEIKWEMDWLLEMQAMDGSVYHKVSTKAFGPAIPPLPTRAKRSMARRNRRSS